MANGNCEMDLQGEKSMIIMLLLKALFLDVSGEIRMIFVIVD